MNILLVLANACEEPDVLRTILFFKKLLKFIYFLVPFFLIIMVTIDLSKNVIAGKEDDMRKNVSMALKRIINTAIVFLIPTIVWAVMNITTDATEDESKSLKSCWDNATTFGIMRAEVKKEATIKLEAAKEKLSNVVHTFNIYAKKVVTKVSTNNNGEGAGNFPGQTFSLNDFTVNAIAHICVREQGNSVDGASAEASLMANMFDLYHETHPNCLGGHCKTLSDFLINSGWFGSGVESAMKNPEYNPTKEVEAAVKDVLVNGKRTMPLYIDEHDCIDCGQYGFDITKLEIDGSTITDHAGLLNKNNYKKDKTIIHNKYGSTYTFYEFHNDPFGYTKESYNKIKNSK